MRALLTVLMTLGMGFATSAQAYELGAFGEVNMNEFDASGADSDLEFGFGFGASAYGDWQAWKWRSGVGLLQRNSTVGNSDFEVTYLQVPATLMMELNNFVRPFAGLALNLNISDDVPAGTDAKTMVFTIPLGVHFQVSEEHRAEVIYDLGLSEVASDVDQGTSLAARYVYMF